MLHAVIGIGSNSTRMIVGEVTGAGVECRRRMREGTRLFAGLADGELSAQSMARVLDAVGTFVRIAREDGVQQLHVIATSAARDATNSDALAELVQEMAGVPMQVLTGEEEARLSFYGATGGARGGVIDIGGGSTELAAGAPPSPLATGSAQLGAARLMGDVPELGGDGLARALDIADTRIRETWEAMGPPQPPEDWYGVGGTLTCLASLDMALPVYDRDAVGGYALSRDAVAGWARRLADMTPQAREALPGMQPQRGDIIAHGAAILLAAMQALEIASVTVSNRSNLDGYLSALAVAPNGVDIVRDFYDGTVEAEWTRLERHPFEFEINRRFIERYTRPGDRVLDVGGGPGRYSLHLAACGCEVTLVDLSEGNIRFAREKAREMGLPLRAECADARLLDDAVDGTYDTVLLMGPLYHLTDEADRVRVVEACLRKLKLGGVLCVAFISMISGMIYAGREMPESILWEGEDVFYDKILRGEDYGGKAFTHAYFIQPANVLPFMARFPLKTLHLVGSEGITAPFHNKLMAQPQAVRDKWLEIAFALCEREDFRNYAEHFLYVGRKEVEE